MSVEIQIDGRDRKRGRALFHDAERTGPVHSVCQALPDRGGPDRSLRDPGRRGRQALPPQLWEGHRRTDRPDREETCAPLPSGLEDIFHRDDRLQLALPLLPEQRDQPAEEGRGGRRHPPAGRPTGQGERMRGDRLHVQRALDLHRVPTRRGQDRPPEGDFQHLRLQRIRHARVGGSDG